MGDAKGGSETPSLCVYRHVFIVCLYAYIYIHIYVHIKQIYMHDKPAQREFMYYCCYWQDFFFSSFV